VSAFPFLIGTVRTYLHSFEYRKRDLFPFLIGTVRTVSGRGNDNGREKFPFLIGTVRTQIDKIDAALKKAVSIPHRYGKN